MSIKVKSKRFFVFLLTSLAAITSASATLTLTADQTSVCASQALVLTLTDDNTYADVKDRLYEYQKTTVDPSTATASDWKQLKDTRDLVVADNQGSTTTYYRVGRFADGSTTGGSFAEYSNTVTVTVNTSNTCIVTCHTSSTGEFIQGTDFNIDTSAASPGILPDGVINYFGDYGLVFDAASLTGYTVSTDFSSMMGTTNIPEADAAAGVAGSNYYMFMDNPNGNAFEIAYPALANQYKTYRFKLRFYITYDCSCVPGNLTNIGSASLNLRTGNGNVSSDSLTGELYDENADTLIYSLTTPKADVTRFPFGKSLSAYMDKNVSENCSHLYRIDLVLYGRFPNANGLNSFKFQPEFAQMNTCSKIALDYVSAEIASICMDHGSVCTGSSATINAAGFLKDAVYNWQVYDETYTDPKEGGHWKTLVVDNIVYTGKSFSRVDIPVTWVGSKTFRVRDTVKSHILVNSKNVWNSTTNQNDIVYTYDTTQFVFNVVGEDCNPVDIDTIVGDTVLCAPGAVSFQIFPVDADASVSYIWNLYAPDGTQITDATILYNTVTDNRGANITINMPADQQTGRYKLTVQQVDTSLGYQTPVGKLFTKYIHVYKTPKASFLVNGQTIDYIKHLCPSDTTVVLTATSSVTVPPSLTYTWYNAVPYPSQDSAKITYGVKHDSLCEGTLTHYAVGLKVALTEQPTCYDSVFQDYEVTAPVDPTINCDSLKALLGIVSGKDTISKYSASGAESITITLPKPQIGGTCDGNPAISIVGSGKDINGKTYSFLIDKVYLKNLTNDQLTVTLPISAGKTGTSGYTFTYTAWDGCGHSSENCAFTIIVRDTVKPDISCSDITSYDKVLLSHQEGCVAVPGYYPTELPILTVPCLKDQTLPSSTCITAVYMGRKENNTTEPAKSEDLFNSHKGQAALNDDFIIGSNYILWKFTDLAQNTSYCLQHVGVFDDREPVLNCPPDTLINVSVQKGTPLCGLSMDTLMASLKKLNLIPSAKDSCEKLNITNPSLSYRVKGTTNWIEITDRAALLFALNSTYELRWTFNKVTSGDHVIDNPVYCDEEFTVVDSLNPIPDCSSLNDAVVTVNISTRKNAEEFDYASASGSNSNYITYTLAAYFGSLPTATDACSGDLSPVVSITDPDGVTQTLTGSNSAVLSALKTFHFPVGTSQITYTFTDAAGNDTSCLQNISVYKKLAINCKSSVELTTDSNCVAYDSALVIANSITAAASYVRQYRASYPWNFEPGVEGSPITTEDEWDFLQNLRDSSTSALANRSVTIYPYQITKITNTSSTGVATSSSETTTVLNTSATESFPDKLVGLMSSTGWFGYTQTGTQIWHSLNLKTGNFTEEFTDAFRTFPKGYSTLIWYFTNDQGDIDSCVTIVNAKDVTPPSVECGSRDSSSIIAADESCVANPVITAPTVNELNAKDNCTALGDIAITFERYFEGTKTSLSLTDAFPIGSTTIKWIVSDKDGNKSFCNQTIVVKDSTGPVVDCSKILKDLISVVADANCEVLPGKIDGLKQVSISGSSDACSPLASPINGVPTRYVNGLPDGKDVFNDAYQLGITVIKWVFSDSVGNQTVCEQTIEVKDETQPVVPACDSLSKDTIKYYLPTISDCSASLDSIKLLLGKNFGLDNCDPDTIWGVPMLTLPSGSLTDLPSVFKKDTTYAISWVFTDAHSNTTICVQHVSVIDTIAPDNSGICPSPDSTMAATVSCSFTFSDLNLPILSIDDPCDGKINAVMSGYIQQPGGITFHAVSQKELEGLTYYAGTKNTFYWTFTDHAGNSSQCVMELTIADSIPPVINNCTVTNDQKYVMSEGVCYAKWSDISDLFVIPIAYDECQELIDGTGPTPLTPSEIRRYYQGKLLHVSTTVEDTLWRQDPFGEGLTRIVWVFTDKAGNVDSCVKQLTVVPRNIPSFNCDSVQPNPMRVVAKAGDCSVPFGTITFKDYYGVNACTGDSIKAHLQMGPNAHGIALPNDYEIYAGDTITLYWVVYDAYDNTKACPQTIIASHSNPIAFSCDSLKEIVDTALAGTCAIPANDLNVPVPFSIDSCIALKGDADSVVTAVGVRSDSLSLSDDYPTGVTYITWTFVSKYNLADTLVCTQPVSIKGNKHFDLDCAVVFPDLKDTIDDCGSASSIVLKAAQLKDPCLDSMITAVAVSRSDTTVMDAPFYLGHAVVTWVFTDATGTISDTCHQNIQVLTSLPLSKPCDTAAMKMINVPAPADACSVPTTDVKLDTPYAISPCSLDTIWGVLSRPSTTLDAPYVIGLNRLVWTFTDTTGTLVKPSDTCQQWVKVGDVDVEPVDCQNMPDTAIVLAAGDCSLDFSELNLNIPPVVDRCPNGSPSADPVTIEPTITRSSNPSWSAHSPADIGAFTVGTDTISYSYIISGNTYVCKQVVSVKDSVAPLFDCGTLLPIEASAASGTCSADKDAILALIKPWPVANESCTNDSIKGVPTLTDGSPLPAKFAVGDTVTILWTFADTSVSIKAKTCEQQVTVKSDIAPIFDCDALQKDTLKFTASGTCSVNLTVDSLPQIFAKDACTGTQIPGVPTRLPGNAAIAGSYPTGYTTIRWTFTSPYSSATSTCDQVIWVRTDLTIDANCGETEYPKITVDIADGCSVPAADITGKLKKHSFEVPCHNTMFVEGVASRSDGKAIDEDYPVGQTTITWTFTGPSDYLLNPVSSCEQIVQVGDKNLPPVDCETSFPDTTIYLDVDNCTADFAQIPVHLDTLPVNPCSLDTATLDTTRASGKAMHDVYEIGTETISWIFTFPSSNQTYICKQKIEVADTVGPDFDCSTLKPVITVALTTGNTVSYDDVVAAGFVIPVVTDKCSDVTTTVTRSDGKDLKEPYEMGSYTITFTFTDKYNNKTVCSQIIKVTDMIPPDLNCPDLENNHFVCLTDTSAAYATYEEFKAAGGSLSDESKVDMTSFSHTDEISGTPCEAVITRTYHILSIRQDDITCSQTLYTKDNVAPTISGIDKNSLVTTCEQMDTIVSVVTATDNCVGVVNDKGNVGKFTDGNVTLIHSRTSTYDADPSHCAHYNYDIVHAYSATDACGNDTSFSFTIHVKDTVAPDVHVPVNWGDSMYPTYMRNCNFGVPDITSLIPSDSIYQSCESNIYLSYTQSPVAGTIIDTTTTVYLYITDVCGNTTTLSKVVKVQQRAQIITLVIPSDSVGVCGSDSNLINPKTHVNLSSTSIRSAYGVIYAQNYKGQWVAVPATFFYDCYLDSISPDNIIYSNNPTTYGPTFEAAISNDSIFASYNALLRRKQTGTYVYVAMDTLSGCKDTGSVYLDVREKPRVSLASNTFNLCDGDALPINGEFGSSFPHCANAMGCDITSEGWYFNGAPYVEGTPIAYAGDTAFSVLYYATNCCGTSTSQNSLYADCNGSPATTADSLAECGSYENLALWRQDKWYPSDSIKLVMYPRYDPSLLLLSTNPQEKARVWEGDDADLKFSSPYTPAVINWMKVVDYFDGLTGATFDKDGNLVVSSTDAADEQIFVSDSSNLANHYTLEALRDSASYYVLIGNGVCPTVASNVVSIDVLADIPTAITPYTKDGINDVFMKGHHVFIFNRYGQKLYEGSNGWDGSYRGLLADPGVYYYEVEMKHGITHKGSIEVVRIDN